AFAALVLSALLLLLRPLLRQDPRLCFWALGCVLATIPVCGTHPEDRVLTATSLGGAALLASLLLALWERRYPHVTPLAKAAGIALCAIHLGLAPLLFPLRTLVIDQFEVLMVRADPSIVRGAEARTKTVVLLNPPVDFFAVYFPSFRAARGVAM